MINEETGEDLAGYVYEHEITSLQPEAVSPAFAEWEKRAKHAAAQN